MEAKVLGRLRNTVVGVLVVAILAGMFLPIYTDEVGWRFQERAGLDGVDKLFNDICGPNTIARPPFFMMPVRYYSAFFNTSFADPFYIRLSGVFYALLWLVLLLVLIRRITTSPSDRLQLSIIGVGLMCLGTMPLLLVWSRPEQPILLATTAALVVAWTSGGHLPAASSARSAWLRSVAILLLAVFAFSYHLKAIFLTPIFLACLFFASRGRHANLPRIVIGALFVIMAAAAANYWVHRLQCPGDPVLFTAFASNNMGMALTGSRNWTELASAAAKIMGNATSLEYFRLPVPAVDPLSNWLEPGQISKGHSRIWSVVLVFLWLEMVMLAVACIYIKVREGWSERHLDARPVLAVIILATVLAWSATQAIRNVYEASLALPLVMLAVIFALSGIRHGNRIGKWVRVASLLIGVLAIVSPLAVAAIYGPPIARASTQKGYLGAQPTSLPAFGYASLKPDILGAARKCGIDDPARAKALMVDDLTYFAFMKSRLPQHQLGVLSIWRGTIDDPIAYLRSRGSGGAIVGCHLLPDELRRRAKSQGAFCCLGPPHW
ncbi:MAG: hypothetical protein LBV50_01120 [Novosphingobium sp.]|nr:hypothetical protein [Novosphingobium sp.]